MWMGDSDRMQPTPPGAPAADEVRRVRAGVERIGRAMVQSVPPGWIRLDLVARVTADYDEMLLRAVRTDGHIPSTDADPQIRAGVLDLRRMMYSPARGAWLSLRLTVDPPLQLQLNVNYHDDPLWTQRVPPGIYRRDLQVFPRPPEQVTGWLRARLDEVG
jgi:hypothetical protein